MTRLAKMKLRRVRVVSTSMEIVLGRTALHSDGCKKTSVTRRHYFPTE